MLVKQDMVGTILNIILFLIFGFSDYELLPSTTKDGTQAITYGNSGFNFSNPCCIKDLPVAFKTAHPECHFVGRKFNLCSLSCSRN